MQNSKGFPVLRDKQQRRAEGNMENVYVPWDFILPHERQAKNNHYQTLERLAQRGGLSWMEMLAVLKDVDFRRINPKAEHKGPVLLMLKEWSEARHAV